MKITFPSPTTALPPSIYPEIEATIVFESTSTIFKLFSVGTATRLSLIKVGAAVGTDPNAINIGFPPFSHSLYGMITRYDPPCSSPEIYMFPFESTTGAN